MRRSVHGEECGTENTVVEKMKVEAYRWWRNRAAKEVGWRWRRRLRSARTRNETRYDASKLERNSPM